MRFLQLIEYRTQRIEEVHALLDEWSATETGVGAPGRSVLGADHDTPDTYISMVEFPSYREAMEHSARAETNAFAERMREICDGEPTFHNVDVLREQSFGPE